VAVDGAGDVFVAGSEFDSVKEVLPGGTIKSIGSGFSGPRGLAVDGAGEVFVVDTLNYAVKKVSPDGSITTLPATATAPAPAPAESALLRIVGVSREGRRAARRQGARQVPAGPGPPSPGLDRRGPERVQPRP
jgi:hypothetical protein